MKGTRRIREPWTRRLPFPHPTIGLTIADFDPHVSK
ncbi:hypothetical protein NS506_00549 [Nocardia seriolae]|uniref:Uncharacterized protein n=1 Tax=Nocardia seriolae TaxID=37332 RepID=A0ABC8AK87_9NOCA|nr:hypothetical protein NS506_00549 [Nocardia seriolae]